MTDARQLEAGWTLLRADGLSPRLAAALVRTYGTPVRALSAARRLGLEAFDGIPRLSRTLAARAVAGIRAAPGPDAAELARLREIGGSAVVLGTDGYPPRLAQIPDPPVILFLRGATDLLAGPAVAVVGTRRTSAYGVRAARMLAGGLAGAGVIVVSGMAAGIDAAGHAAALEAGGGSIGVLGTGLGHRYPRSNRSLYRRMEAAGLLVTEFEYDQGPAPYTFPRRNRVIAGLADAVVVVEAPEKSGALITAEYAEGTRPVFAVPGPIDSRRSVGTNALLADGATPALSARVILEELGWSGLAADRAAARGHRTAGRGGTSPADADGERVLSLLEGGPLPLDRLANEARLPAARLHALLTRLEIESRVQREVGGAYALASGPAAPAGFAAGPPA